MLFRELFFLQYPILKIKPAVAKNLRTIIPDKRLTLDGPPIPELDQTAL